MGIIILLICVANPVVIDKINANYDKIEILSGKITRHYKINDDEKQITGKFYLKKPNKLFVKYSNPEQTIILNDTLLWVYSPNNKQVIKINYKKLSEGQKSLLGLGALLGINPLQGFEKAFIYELQDSIHLSAKPSHKPKFISKIIFQFDPQKNIILQTQIFDTTNKIISQTNYGDWKSFQPEIWFPQCIISKIYMAPKEITEESIFHEISINCVISDKQFEFVPPEGTKIIEGGE
ncbi:MAG: outer membrane lipoprotein carrier protein LolA [bacterium]|nr:outer membrane lipoprotein carrier protein LolA [bacterium]